MNERTQDRLFAACGIASVVLELGAVAIGAAGGRTMVSISSTPAQVAHALAMPAGTGVWVGAYIEMLSVGFFLAFAVWASAKLGGGLLGAVARAAGTSYATLTVASLGVLNAVEFRAGHGMGVQLATALTKVNEAIYVGTWFLAGFFLLAAGALALTSGRRALGRGAIGIAAITLVGTAVSIDNLGQNAVFLWLVWIVWASISLARGERARTPTVAAA
jgi:hypothetical protein